MTSEWVRPLILTTLRDGGPMRFRDLCAVLPPVAPDQRRFYPSRLIYDLAWLRRHGLVERINPGPRPLWSYVKGAPDDE